MDGDRYRGKDTRPHTVEVLTQVIGNILPGLSSLVLLRLMIMFGGFAMTSRLWLKIMNLVLSG